MKEKKEKAKFRIRHVFFLLFVIYICSTLISQQKMMRNLKTQKVEKEKEVKELQGNLNELNDEIKNTDSLEFIEKVAREELKMVKPREIIYVDINKKKDPFLMDRKN